MDSGFTTAHRNGEKVTEKQRKEIENFIKNEGKIMTIQQAQAIAQAILENYDMLKELTGSKQQGAQIQPIGIPLTMAMDSPEEIAKKTRRAMRGTIERGV